MRENLLVAAVQRLSLARDLPAIVEIVRHAARELTGADGASFILREGDRCYYVDEDAVGPLWKGKRFPLSACISGWAMLNGRNAVIEDIYQDARIPVDAYRPTFVKSLVMVPIRSASPIGAIGNYWGRKYLADAEEVRLLQSLADSTSIALENVQLFSELNKSLDETKKARDDLQRQLLLRDEFISVAAHELKTPFTPLLIQFQFLQKLVLAGELERCSKKELFEKCISFCGSEIQNINSLIDHLLDLSRIRLEELKIELGEEVDFCEIVQKTILEFQLRGSPGIEHELQPKLTGDWDPVRLKQVVRSLISNAVKYGGDQPIRVSLSSTTDVAFLSVEDRGIGIAKEDQERIFDRFERAASIKSYPGMGLGLYLTKEIVRSHGGTIEVTSDGPGKGSHFRVALPKKPVP